MSEAQEADAAGAVPFAHFARFVSVDPVKNRFRCYELRWQPVCCSGTSAPATVRPHRAPRRRAARGGQPRRGTMSLNTQG